MDNKQIWAIGGGKGGIGKSFLSTNLGITLAKNKHRVIMIDADLGGANLHTFLGVNNSQPGLSDFVNRKVESLKDIVIPTPTPHLYLIHGSQDSLNIANPKHVQKTRLLREIQQLEGEFIILDLGAGTTFNTLDFFLMADLQIIVVLPQPTSIENSYRFIKSALYRKLRQNAPTAQIRSIVDQAIEKDNPLKIHTPLDLIRYLKKVSHEASDFVEQQIQSFRPKLIMNQVRSPSDIRIGFAMDNACSKYFGMHLDFMGYIHDHEIVPNSIIQRKPLLVQFSDSDVALRIEEICYNLLNNRPLQLKANDLAKKQKPYPARK